MKHTIKKAFSLFLSLGMVLSLVGGILPTFVPEAKAAETPDLKVGVISDVHLGYAWDPDLQTPRFYKALKTYKEMGVDAIIIAGDLNDQGVSSLTLEGQKAYMEEFADVWFAVFPEEKGEEGYVEPVLIYGNHDVDLIAAGYWPERFGTYSDVQTWEVNGYQFVGAHNGKENKVTTEVADAVAATPDKPVFYIQHCPIAYTVGRSMGGYGANYSLAGRNNISAYSNIVSFAGHNHMPLTDERSIWQGESWNDGRFTAINTASLNYGDADADEGGINGVGTATQHGMLMTVTGSEVSIERFSFEGLSVDLAGVTVTANSSYGSKAQYTNVSELATKAVTGNYVKIGKTWFFDACDVTDRPYTYSARVAAANQPVFNTGDMTVSGAEESDGTYTLTVTVPAATVADPANGVYRDIVHNYIVEACDPLTGEVEAFASEASEFHIDDDPSRLSDSYTMQITGLESGKTYTVNAYARETFQKRSVPLTATYTAGGTLTSFRTGDINTDGVVNEDDLALLNKILAGEAASNSMVDVDGNKIVEKADATALENLLAGKTMVTDEGDLMSGATTPAWSSTTAFTQMQTAVTRGDSNIAYNSYAIKVSSWPDAYIYFEEPQNWSGKNVINFDILFENEYKVGDYTSPTRQVRFYVISGENKERSTGYLSRESFDTDEAGWCSYSLYLNTLGNVDWSNVCGLLLDINYDGASNRFDGVTPHGFYLDNVTTSLSTGKTDDDILGQVTTVTGGKIVYNTGDTRNSYQAIKSTSSEMVVTLADSYKLSRFKELFFDNKLSNASTFTVQAMDASGNLLGKAVTVNSFNGWNKAVVNPDDMELDSNAQVARLQFTTTGTLVIDNLSLTAKEDPNDLLATATMNSLSYFPAKDWYDYDTSCFTVNGEESVTSWHFINLAGSGWPVAVIDFAENLNLEDNILKFDIKFEVQEDESGSGFFRYDLFDAEGNKLLYPLSTNDISVNKEYKGGFSYNEDGWATVSLDLSDMGADVSSINSLALQFSFDIYSNIYVDNMRCEEIPKPETDDLLTVATITGGTTTWYYPIPELTEEVTNPDNPNSVRSWKWSCESATPTTIWTFAETLDLTGMDLKFDVKFENEKSDTYKGASFKLYDVNDNVLVEKNGARWANNRDDNALLFTEANADGWYTVTLNLSDVEFDRTVVRKIFLSWCFDGNIGPIYIDNMRLERGKLADPDDLLADATISGHFVNAPQTYGYDDNCEVVNGSSSTRSWKLWSKVGQYWPKGKFTFGAAQDMSVSALQFNVKFDAYTEKVTKPYLAYTLYDASGTALNTETAISGWDTTFKPDANGWYTVTITLSDLDADLSAVAAIEFKFDFDNNAAVYLDNLKLIGDTDLIGQATVSKRVSTGSAQISKSNKVTNNSINSLLIEGAGTGGWHFVDLTFDDPIDMSSAEALYMDIKRTGANSTFRVTLYDADGDAVYYRAPATVNCDWTTLVFTLGYTDNSGLTAVNAQDLKDIKRITIQLSIEADEVTVIDNLRIGAREDDDIASKATLIAHSSLEGDVINVGWSDQVTNGSERAIFVDATNRNNKWSCVTLTFKNPLDLRTTPYLYLDVKRTGGAGDFKIKCYNASGTVIMNTSYTNIAVDKWTTVAYDLRNNNGTAVDREMLKDVAKIELTFSMAQGRTIAIDNIYAKTSVAEDILAGAAVTNSDSNGKNFVLEVIDKTDDGLTNVFHMVSDPANDGAIGNGWPWFYIKPVNGVILQNYSGYDISGFEFLEFKIKMTSNINNGATTPYIRMRLLSPNGATLGSDDIRADNYATAVVDSWVYYRIPMSAFGLTESQLKQFGQFRIGFATGKITSSGGQFGEVFIDNLRFGVSDGDLLSSVYAETKRFWQKQGVTLEYQSELTNGSAEAMKFTTDPNVNNDPEKVSTASKNCYSWQNIDIKLPTAMTVQSDWQLSFDGYIHNLDNYLIVRLVGSDGKIYSPKATDGGTFQGNSGAKDKWVTRLSSTLDQFAAPDGTILDPTSITIVEIRISFDVYYDDNTKLGFWALDNVKFVKPTE